MNKKVKVLTVVFSCEKNKNLWKEILSRKVRNLIIVKGGLTKEKYNLKDKILSLNCNDYYDGLPEKTISVIDVFLKNPSFKEFTHILKVDDHDTFFDDKTIGKIENIKIKPEDDYVGQRIWVSSSGKLSSKWHIQSGQCKENSYWSNREYKGEIPNSFARGGQAYILSRNAMQQINKVYSMNDLEELSKIHIYEDVMVGLLLEKAGINVKHLRFGVKI
jgi:hypothetical protein